MKFTLQFKTPDVLDQIRDQVSDKQLIEEFEEEISSVEEFARKFVKWSRFES